LKRTSLAVTAALLCGVVACGTRWQSTAGEAMATRWEVVLPDRPGAREAAREAIALFQRLDLELSEWREGSPLSAVNRAAGLAPVEVPTELFSLLEKSLALGQETAGAFDVSWAALWGLWDFRSPSGKVPAAFQAFQIEERRALVDYRRVQLDPVKRTAYLPVRGMKLGLGGIGKGYALDRAAELLAERGFTDFLLIGGGQVLAQGTRSGRPWRVGIRDPRGGPDDFFARVELDGQEQVSLSTSADNEAYFEVGGVRYHHILDPRTGWPSRGLRSATVLHREATVADALSTALMVLGKEPGFAVVERLGGEALVVDERGEVATTAGLAQRLETLHPPKK
jgi:thiamine biosynthesis lipoprotein